MSYQAQTLLQRPRNQRRLKNLNQHGNLKDYERTYFSL